MANIKPLGDRVVIKNVEAEETSLAAASYCRASAKKKPQMFKVPKR